MKRLLVGLAFLPASILLLYVLLSPPVAWPLYQCMLFKPIRQLPNTQADQEVIQSKYHATLNEVEFPSADGAIIHGRYFDLPGAKKIFLVSEGCGANIYHRFNHAQFLLQCGGSVLQYDYQGFGASEGKPSLDRACDDVLAAYDFLIYKQRKKPEEIVAWGDSFGTGVTGQLVARRKVAGVILQSGFTSVLRAGRDLFAWLRLYPDYAFPNQILDNVAVFKKAHPPLLIIHGDKDNQVSIQNAYELYEQAAQPKALLIVPNAGHSFFCYRSQNKVTEFLKALEHNQPLIGSQSLATHAFSTAVKQ
jgi:fermentation-respiration switch protein FrsA (DUF1100 family)